MSYFFYFFLFTAAQFFKSATFDTTFDTTFLQLLSWKLYIIYKKMLKNFFKNLQI